MRPSGLAWNVALIALGLLAMHAQAFQPQQVFPFPDDSILARDALPRVVELSEAGNNAEAVRVIQAVLDTEAERVVQAESGPGSAEAPNLSFAGSSLFVAVRTAAHRVLLSHPTLLERYRVIQTPVAQALLESADLHTLERSYFMTTPGLEATLRLAQLELEACRFESARRLLESLDDHPDRATEAPARAGLAMLVVSYLPRPEVIEWAKQLGSDAPSTIEWPSILSVPAISPLSRQPALDSANLPAAALHSVPIEREIEVPQDSALALTLSLRDDANDKRTLAWILPTSYQSSLFVNDGLTVAAFDHATLGPLWRFTPNSTGRTELPSDLTNFAMSSSRGLEDAATVTVHAGTVFAVMGTPSAGSRSGDRSVYALNAASGEVVWSAVVESLDSRLRDTSIRGPIVIEEDTVVVTCRRASGSNRTNALYLVGLQLNTGELKWVRHLGSIGTISWNRQPSRPEGAIAWRGLVIRPDEMGLIGAVEASSGRPAWVRLLSHSRGAEGFSGPQLPPPFEVAIPVIDGDSLLTIEPGAKAILRIDAESGRLLERREIVEDSRDPEFQPKYLLLSEEWIFAVCARSVVMFPRSDLSSGKMRLGPALAAETAPRGRAVISGSQLIIPVATGLLIIDPADPRNVTTQPLNSPGNVVVTVEGGQAHLLTADGAKLHTHLKWETAESVLKARQTANPQDPRPVLTYIELAARAGAAALVPQLATRALDLAAQQEAAAGDATRESLFDLLLAISSAALPPAGEKSANFLPIGDGALRESIIEKLGEAAQSPVQRAAHLFELATLRESQTRIPEALESYQKILLDPEVAAAPSLTPGTGLAAASSTAREIATGRMMTLLKSSGPGPYQAFEEQAVLEIASLPEGADAESVAALALRYPFCSQAPGLWRRASKILVDSGRRKEGQKALGKSLSTAETLYEIGRDDQRPNIAIAASDLIAMAAADGQTEGALRLVRRIGRRYSALMLQTGEGDVSPATLASTLELAVKSRTHGPRVGDALASTVQVVAGWTPSEPLIPDLVGRSGDCIPMESEVLQRIGVWGSSVESPEIGLLWERPFSLVKPVILGVRHDVTLLLWPTAGGGEIEGIGTSTGETLWRSKNFTSLFEGGAVAPGTRFDAPLDQQVGADDFIVTSTPNSIVLVQRRGRICAISLEDGRALWARELPLARVFDVLVAEDSVLVGGVGGGSGENNAAKGQANSVLVSISRFSGVDQGAASAELVQDHVRWMRSIPGGDVLLSTSGGLARVNARSLAVVWSQPGKPGAMSSAGWVVGDSAFLADEGTNLWALSLKEGRIAQQACETKGRMDSFPLRGAAAENRFVILSPSGVAVFGPGGELLGVDAMNLMSRFLPPTLVSNKIVLVEASEEDDREFGGESPSVIRLSILDSLSAKTLSMQRLSLPRPEVFSLSAIDGKLLISIGDATLVYDVPLEVSDEATSVPVPNQPPQPERLP